MTGLDSTLHLPRRSEPRTNVPGGSVAIAMDQTVIYPLDSPGVESYRKNADTPV